MLFRKILIYIIVPAIKEFKDEGRISCNLWCYSPNMIEIK